MGFWQPGMEFVPQAMQQEPCPAATWKPGLEFVPQGLVVPQGQRPQQQKSRPAGLFMTVSADGRPVFGSNGADQLIRQHRQQQRQPADHPASSSTAPQPSLAKARKEDVRREFVIEKKSDWTKEYLVPLLDSTGFSPSDILEAYVMDSKHQGRELERRPWQTPVADMTFPLKMTLVGTGLASDSRHADKKTLPLRRSSSSPPVQSEAKSFASKATLSRPAADPPVAKKAALVASSTTSTGDVAVADPVEQISCPEIREPVKDSKATLSRPAVDPPVATKAAPVASSTTSTGDVVVADPVEQISCSEIRKPGKDVTSEGTETPTTEEQLSNESDLEKDDHKAEVSGQPAQTVDEQAPLGDVTFSRKFLILMGVACQDDEVPKEIAGFHAEETESSWQPGKLQRSRSAPGDIFDRSMFGSKAQSALSKSASSNKQPALVVSENAYKLSKPKAELCREEQLKREVNSLLNKVCPENIDTIVVKVADTEVRSVEELELLISLIFKKSLAEPHYCETYADMVAALKQRVPEFPSENGGRPVTFKAALLNTTQSEFESLSDVLSISADEMQGLDLEEIEYLKKKRKDRVLANMKFIGQLFLRKLLGAKVIGSVIQELAKCDEESSVPEEPMVECLCELIANIGFTLEETQLGEAALANVLGRLKDLKQRPAPEGCKGGFLYSKRIQFAIQDVLDIKAAGWTKKTFKASAKTKEEIKKEHNRDLERQKKGGPVDTSELQLAGARPLATPVDDGKWQVKRR